MKLLALYASKYGCTEDCVKYLLGKLDCESDMVNLKNGGAIDLASYDWVVIGGSVMAGRIQKEVRQFCAQNLSELLSKKVALGLCCMAPTDAENYFKNNFPPELLAHAERAVKFGGEVRADKMSFMDRKITGLAAKLASGGDAKILYENIDSLADLINSK